jgi:hypothetical protein
MPTILREGPYRFYFYSDEGQEPAHVHVYRDGNVAKFWLSNVTLAANYGFAARELNVMVQLIREHRNEFLKAWHGYFGSAGR